MPSSFRFGTVGSPIATPKKPGGSVGAIHFSKSIGLTALELGWVQSVRVSEETCALIKAAGADQDVAVSVHAPYFINLNATADEWPKSRKRLMDAAYYGNLAGATDIIFHPGSYFGNDPADVLKLRYRASRPASMSCAVRTIPSSCGPRRWVNPPCSDRLKTRSAWRKPSTASFPAWISRICMPGLATAA